MPRSEPLGRSPTGMALPGGERELALTRGLGQWFNGGVDALIGVPSPAKTDQWQREQVLLQVE
eukprot:8379074-Prorocentrum_lima.AAC.1